MLPVATSDDVRRATVAAHSAERDLGDVCRVALEALPEPVMIYDEERVVFANRAAQRLLGADGPEDLDGVDVGTFLVPELADVSPERRRYVMRNRMEFSRLPIKVRTMDGRIAMLVVDIRPISFDGTTVAMVTLAH
jgi:PAS domain S-box-containing protein